MGYDVLKTIAENEVIELRADNDRLRAKLRAIDKLNAENLADLDALTADGRRAKYMRAILWMLGLNLLLALVALARLFWLGR